eukprot:m.13643 g.13643  ORF g.13643 m.13643 type:complete len:152 (-) comp10195_c0_seq1:83-538(-)
MKPLLNDSLTSNWPSYSPLKLPSQLLITMVTDKSMSQVWCHEQQSGQVRNTAHFVVAELDKWLTKENLIFSVSQVTALLLEMDVNGNDEIDFLEFLALCQELKNPDTFQDQHATMAPTTQAAFASIRRTFMGSRRQSVMPDQDKSKTCILQ